MVKKTLGSLKVDEVTLDRMMSAIKKHNSENVLQMKQADFRRLSLEVLAHLILTNQPISVKVA